MLVNVQTDMAVETLPAIHDPNLYKTKEVEDDSVFEESFRLEVSEDEEEVVAGQTKTIQNDESITAKNEGTSIETELKDKNEENTLGNNSETNLSNNKNDICVHNNDVYSKDIEDDTTTVNNNEDATTLDIEKNISIVEDNVQNVEDKTSVANEEDTPRVGDVIEKDENNKYEKEKDEDTSNMDETISESTPKATVSLSKPDEDIPRIERDTPKLEENVSKVDQDNKDESSKEESNEQSKQQKEQEKEKDDILKDQIMDTEDLLQIVDKEQTEETDKEDSSGRNSPRSPEEDLETDKMAVECDDAEAEKMDCDEEEDDEEHPIVKQAFKDNDVDIDESSPYKDCDVDIDKEDNNLAANTDLNEYSKETTKKSETSTEEKDVDNKIDTEIQDKVSDIQPTQQKDENSEVECTTIKEKKQSDDSSEKKSEGNKNMECSVATLIAKETMQTPKRPLTTESDVESDPKKFKLDEPEDADRETTTTIDCESKLGSSAESTKETTSSIGIHALIDEYVKLKSSKKLTYRDLEQIVLQKICEAICYKSEIGEMRHQLAFQEKMVEMWKKEVIQIKKQVRDLEVINKKLIQDVRLNNVKRKQVVPIKITRSVGLQVRADNTFMAPKSMGNGPQVLFPVKQYKIQNIANNKVNTVSTTKATTASNGTATTAAMKSVLSRDPKNVITLTEVEHKKLYNENQVVKVRTPTGVLNPARIVYITGNQLHNDVVDSSKTGSAKLNLSSLETNRVQPARLPTPAPAINKHPAPLPPPPANQSSLPSQKPLPPEPHISIKRSKKGLILSWRMPYNLKNYEAISSYQLYAYQETTSLPNTNMWRKVGEVKALPLPMACTLTQFADGNKYHFAVRAVDVFKRMGPFSNSERIVL